MGLLFLFSPKNSQNMGFFKNFTNFSRQLTRDTGRAIVDNGCNNFVKIYIRYVTISRNIWRIIC